MGTACRPGQSGEEVRLGLQHLHGHGRVPGGSQGMGVSKAGDTGRSEDRAVTREGGPFPCLLGAIPFCLCRIVLLHPHCWLAALLIFMWK